jgi:hypothetical protein
MVPANSGALEGAANVRFTPKADMDIGIAQDYEKLAKRAPTRCENVAGLSHFLDSRFWRCNHARSKLSAVGTLKPNLAQLGVMLANGHIAGFMRRFETLFRQFPIMSGCRHRFAPSLEIIGVEMSLEIDIDQKTNIQMCNGHLQPLPLSW